MLRDFSGKMLGRIFARVIPSNSPIIVPSSHFVIESKHFEVISWIRLNAAITITKRDFLLLVNVPAWSDNAVKLYARAYVHTGIDITRWTVSRKNFTTQRVVKVFLKSRPLFQVIVALIYRRLNWIGLDVQLSCSHSVDSYVQAAKSVF